MNTISLAIKDLLEEAEYGLDLRLIAGEAGLSHRLYSSRIQKPGLALTGYTEHLHPDRVQVLGNTEISYLSQLPEDQAVGYVQTLCSFPISCFIITKGLDPPDFLKNEEALQSLAQTGFQAVPLQEGVELLSNQGEIRCRTKNGVEYILRFGDIAVEEGTFSGTHTGVLHGPLGDVPPTGRAVRLPYIQVLRFRDPLLHVFQLRRAR